MSKIGNQNGQKVTTHFLEPVFFVLSILMPVFDKTIQTIISFK